MLPRAVLKRINDWERLLSLLSLAYSSSLSEASKFTPYRLAVGRKMRLLINLEKLLPKPPQDLYKMVLKIAKNFNGCIRSRAR